MGGSHGSNVLSRGSCEQAWFISQKTCSCPVRSFSAKRSCVGACSHGDQIKSGLCIRAAPTPGVESYPLVWAGLPSTHIMSSHLAPPAYLHPAGSSTDLDFSTITPNCLIQLTLMNHKPPQSKLNSYKQHPFITSHTSMYQGAVPLLADLILSFGVTGALGFSWWVGRPGWSKIFLT